MDFYLTQIMIWTLNWVPDGWLICNGQQLQVSQYNALYSLIGNQFGGTVNVSFNLPDLRGRLPIGFGLGTGLLNNYTFAQKYGAETTPIAQANLPAHTHTATITNLTATGGMQVTANPAQYPTPNQNTVLAAVATNAVEENISPAYVNMYGDPNNLITLNYGMNLSVTGGGNFTTNPTGGNVPIANIPPVLALNYAMCVQGLYPVRP